MADQIRVLTRSLTLGPLDPAERADLARIPGLHGGGEGGSGTRTGPTTDATVVLDGTTVRLGPQATEAVLGLLGRLASGASVTVSEQDRWLNTSQAARLAGVSNTYLRQLTDRGEIPVTYRGSHRRIHPDDVAAWVGRRDQGRQNSADRRADREGGDQEADERPAIAPKAPGPDVE